VAQACPPLKALLHIMLHDQWEGKTLETPEFRNLFTRESMLPSDWYATRLKAKQSFDVRLWTRHVKYLERFLKRASYAEEAERLDIGGRLLDAKRTLATVESPAYLKTLWGTLGAEPIELYVHRPHK
jgi:hypothetical protein